MGTATSVLGQGRKPVASVPLIRSFAEQSCTRRVEQNLDIERKGPRLCIAQIQTNHLVELGLASSIHLPEPGNARLRLEQASPVPDVIVRNLVAERWSRPY